MQSGNPRRRAQGTPQHTGAGAVCQRTLEPRARDSPGPVTVLLGLVSSSPRQLLLAPSSPWFCRADTSSGHRRPCPVLAPLGGRPGRASPFLDPTGWPQVMGASVLGDPLPGSSRHPAHVGRAAWRGQAPCPQHGCLGMLFPCWGGTPETAGGLLSLLLGLESSAGLWPVALCPAKATLKF